jgi:hypothetical protein
VDKDKPDKTKATYDREDAIPIEVGLMFFLHCRLGVFL